MAVTPIKCSLSLVAALFQRQPLVVLIAPVAAGQRRVQPLEFFQHAGCQPFVHDVVCDFAYQTAPFDGADVLPLAESADFLAELDWEPLGPRLEFLRDVGFENLG